MRVYNPIGWRRRVEDRVAALGPLDQLPRGIHAQYVVDSTDLRLIRHCHHLEDVASFDDNAVERAGTIVRLAATGALLHVADHDPALETLLGAGLYGLVTMDMQGADAATREMHSIRMRRIALRDHSHESRIRQVCGTILEHTPQIPAVSILLSTNRPDFLTWAVSNVAKQNYPRLELVLALHGDGFDHVAVERAVAPLKCDVQIVQVAAERPFPDALNVASGVASGEMLTKMDDDDCYDKDHISDLMLAHTYSGAHLVGKGVETIYLQGRDQTVERDATSAETYSRNIAGGTLLVSRKDLKTIGDWRGVPPYVDKTLIDDVVQQGGIVYRTHGRGYVLIRHGAKHSWRASDQYFIDGATAVHSGWHGLLSGMDEPAPNLRQGR